MTAKIMVYPTQARLARCCWPRSTANLQGIPPLAFPDVGPHGWPSQLFRRSNAVMTVREKQDAVNIEYHDGSGIIQVLEVIRHSVGV